eukprot:CAMPEP_0115523212 /NCGR_PEP_ID=MMETSP0271-20121206/80507_1 /TAXON_ID=71861 /ORGANISM="Scrippsiella trochoidea, Strain CCMP3099" /LENGTH=77 /DNA_ID=CAMNT_0002954591 /DNA_START=111 /DNA_END=345 /DNA_ORIENTATION=-
MEARRSSFCRSTRQPSGVASLRTTSRMAPTSSPSVTDPSRAPELRGAAALPLQPSIGWCEVRLAAAGPKAATIPQAR